VSGEREAENGTEIGVENFPVLVGLGREDLEGRKFLGGCGKMEAVVVRKKVGDSGDLGIVGRNFSAI
jgi:hypothetical protein